MVKGQLPFLSLGPPNFEFGSAAPMRTIRVVCRVEERCVRCGSWVVTEGGSVMRVVVKVWARS